MLISLIAAVALFPVRPLWTAPAQPAVLRAAQVRLADAGVAEKLPFDDVLVGVISAAEAAGSLEPVLDGWLEKMDELFVPTLASRLDAMASAERPDYSEVAKCKALLSAIERRTQVRFGRARDQLQELLGAGEINAMDAKLCKLIAKGELDAGFLFVLFKNIDDARNQVREVPAAAQLLAGWLAVW